MPIRLIHRYLQLESASGILLFIMAVVALVLDNSPLSSFYQTVFNVPLQIQIGEWEIVKPLLFWINEGLMTLFFLLVGLELKREFLEGELSGKGKIILPGIAALGGMLVPALFFILVNYPHPETMKGWAIPVATDIAFALGVLSLLGRRVPHALKLFLMALAIFDDVGAIFIIAFFHSQKVECFALLIALVLLLALLTMNILGVRRLIPYVLIGIVLWVCVLWSGVHATIAGVLLALFIPLKKVSGESISPARSLEATLHPWIAFLVMPLFALANAGVSLQGFQLNFLLDKVVLGTVLGLVLGKQLGVFGFIWIAIRLQWAKLPSGISWSEMYGVALICGIGFTMSLFLGTLAFEHDNPMYLTQVRVGVLLGSAISGILGAAFLYTVLDNKIKRGRKLEASS